MDKYEKIMSLARSFDLLVADIAIDALGNAAVSVHLPEIDIVARSNMLLDFEKAMIDSIDSSARVYGIVNSDKNKLRQLRGIEVHQL
jgi:hypothetical protein